MSNHKNALKTAWNDVTGDKLTTAGKGSLDKYASGWDAIFGKKKEHADDCPIQRDKEFFDKLFSTTRFTVEESPMELGHFVMDDSCVEPLATDDSHVIPMTVVKALDFHDGSSNWVGKLLDGDSIEYTYDEHLGWVIK